MQRDFTYIDDIAEGTINVLDQPPASTTINVDMVPPYKIYNIGNQKPVGLVDYISTIEKAIGKKAELQLLPMQPGDMKATYADIDVLRSAAGFEPSTLLNDGIQHWVSWFKKYHNLD